MSPADSDPVRRLREAIANRKVLVVVGAGVSFGASKRPEALWKPLLHSGVERCEMLGRQPWPDWAADRHKAVDSGDTEEMITVAEQVSSRLGAPGRPFLTWLQETVGELPAEDASVIETLNGLGCPILTTNYDSLLETVTGRQTVTWQETARALRVIRGDEPGILHLHGHWARPESVVLGIRSYDTLKRNEGFQALLKAVALIDDLLFVGCGATFEDPNLGALFSWLRRKFPDQQYRHYRLAPKADVARLRVEHAHDPMLIVPYPSHDSLASLLRQLIPTRPAPGPPAGPKSLDAEREAFATWVREHQQGVHLVGLGAGDLELPLADVYVPLRLKPEFAPEEGGKGAAGGEAGRRAGGVEEVGGELELELERIFTTAGLPAEAPHRLILGDPGVGKTTALRKLAHLCLAEGEGPGALGLPPGTLPVLVRLRRLDRELLGQSLGEAIERELAEQAPRAREAGIELPDGLGRRLWRRGRLLLLLDGLDEIAERPRRAEVCAYLVSELRDADRRQVRAVVSCRGAGYDPDNPPAGAPPGPRVRLPESFVPLAVRPLDRFQVPSLVTRWFAAARAAVQPTRVAGLAGAEERLLAALEGEAYAAQRLKVLVSNPLLLTLLCVAVYHGDELPRQRTSFYEQCLRVLLGKWRQLEKGREPLLDTDTAISLLRSLAWKLHNRERHDDLSRASLLLHLQTGLARLGRATDPLALADWLHREAGVLTEYAPHRFGFFHLGIQEYLAALHVAAEGETLFDELCGHAGEWGEVLLLLMGLPGRRFGPLVRRLLDAGALERHFDLLRTCLGEAAEVDLAPFLKRLQPEEEVPQQVAVLRLLRGRRDPELLARLEKLAEVGSEEVRALAAQILREAASEAPAPVRAGGDLFLLAGPAGSSDAAELAALVHDRGTSVRFVTTDSWEDAMEQVLAAGTLGLVVAEEAPPWAEPGVEDLLRFAAGRGQRLLVLRFAGRGPRPEWPADLASPSWIELARHPSPSQLVAIEATLAGAPVPPAVRGIGEAGKAPLIDPTTGIRLLWIRGGRFAMGAEGVSDEARPVHSVRLSSFWLAETPVTNAQYAKFLTAARYTEPVFWRDRRFSDPEQPVVGVSWRDAKAFCDWLTKVSGRPVTLPSEAQWEYAARGEEALPYPWGPEPPDATRACYELGYEKGKPAPVGSFPAGRGPFGTLDQAGNVWEWCLDVWNARVYREREGREAVDPVVGKGDAGGRPLRGGGWSHDASYLRSAVRLRSLLRSRYDGVGFRVAVSPPSR